MEKIILYHGSPEKKFTPEYGKGNDKHDYGRGFYLTDNKELAQEWAVCIPDTISGWVHKYELDCTGLKRSKDGEQMRHTFTLRRHL